MNEQQKKIVQKTIDTYIMLYFATEEKHYLGQALELEELLNKCEVKLRLVA